MSVASREKAFAVTRSAQAPFSVKVTRPVRSVTGGTGQGMARTFSSSVTIPFTLVSRACRSGMSRVSSRAAVPLP